MQHASMLPWLGEDPIATAMCARLGVGDWRSAAADADWTHRNLTAQLLLTGLALAAWRSVAAELPPPGAVAGYSVGELAAFSAAGVLGADTALDLAARRAEAMDRCAADRPGGLLAVSRLPLNEIERRCYEAGLSVAICNGEDSVVVGGPTPALDILERDLTERGARYTRLQVRIASHTPWMRQAAEEFLRALADVPFQRPSAVLYSNYAAERVLDAGGAKHALAAQIASTVRWAECMELIRARNVPCVLEVGPGQALARMWNERYPDIPARSVDEFRSRDAIVDWVKARLQRLGPD